MGKASKWLKALLGFKNPDSNPKPQPSNKKWSFAKSHKEKQSQSSEQAATENDNDPGKHAVAVAAATAAVAKAAVAAAQAAAVVVKLTSGGRMNPLTGGRCGSRMERAAVLIQSHFRAYLSRRALRALKALVKLQALARGHLVRKQTADILRRMQALMQAQKRARAGRFLISESPHSSAKSSHISYQGPATPEKFEHVIRTRSMKHEQLTMLKRNGSKSFDSERLHVNHNRIDSQSGDQLREQELHTRDGPPDEERGDKILEVDTGKPCFAPTQKTVFNASHISLGSGKKCQSIYTSNDFIARRTVLSPTSCEVQSLISLNPARDNDEGAFCTADNSPQFYSTSSIGGSSKREAFTPSKSDGSRSCLGGYSYHPNYMAYTESSKRQRQGLTVLQNKGFSMKDQARPRDTLYMDMLTPWSTPRESRRCMPISLTKLIQDLADWTGWECLLEEILPVLVAAFGTNVSSYMNGFNLPLLLL